MSKVLEVLGGIVTAAALTVTSGVEKACEVVSEAACTGAKIVNNVADGVAEAAKDRGKNNSMGND